MGPTYACKFGVKVPCSIYVKEEFTCRPHQLQLYYVPRPELWYISELLEERSQFLERAFYHFYKKHYDSGRSEMH